MTKERPIAVYISVDMEGVGGVAVPSQVSTPGIEYERARAWMANEVNAAIEGAASAGAERFLVNDSHGEMHNLVAEEIDPRAELLIGYAKPWAMGEGIDGGFDTCFFIGYHGRAGHSRAMFAHTYGSRRVFELRLDGAAVGETTLNAYLAGHFGASVSMVSGDDATCEEAQDLLSDVVTVKTKDATGGYSGKMVHPRVVEDRLRSASAKAVEISRAIKPLRPEGRMKIDITFFTSSMADTVELIPGTRRTGPRSVSYSSRNYLSLYKSMLAMVRLAPSAVPAGA